MPLLDDIRNWFKSYDPETAVQARHGEPLAITEAAQRAFGGTSRLYTPATITEALGVPAIQRCVTLISNTAASLLMQGFRDGALMEPTPRLLARPDPFEVPFLFYRDTYFGMAAAGEAVWWVAARDSDGQASSLINVPLHELKVTENERNRLLPDYQWGDIKGTRWSPANPSGKFVHIFYARSNRFSLRGVGPLQMCGAAVSVAVESQDWAANFFADGGNSHTVIHAEGSLSADDTDDAEFENEAANIRDAWVNGPNNTVKVIDDAIKEVTYHDTDTGSAQMLQGRDYSNGDAGRMFGVNGSLLEFSASGSSIQYSNLEGEYTKLIRTCLAPNYLEIVEQTLTDLMPRTQVARANVFSLTRADIKTRYEVHALAIENGIYDADYAAQMEGIIPGNPEVAPVQFAPPSAIPSGVPSKDTAQLGSVFVARSAAPVEVRCDGMTTKRRSGIPRLERCNALLSRDGTFVGKCRRCKKAYVAAA